MKYLALAAALALTACAPGVPLVPSLPVAPGAVAVLDEQAAIKVEIAYKALRSGLELATDAGLIKGERAVTVAALDNRAYALVQATRAAYRAGNRDSYLAIAAEARTALQQFLTALTG